MRVQGSRQHLTSEAALCMPQPLIITQLNQDYQLDKTALHLNSNRVDLGINSTPFSSIDSILKPI